MSDAKIKPKPKWWNNGWLGLVTLLVGYATLFLVGKKSVQYEPDPVYDGLELSDWTDALSSYDALKNYDRTFYDMRNRAPEVLRRHQQVLSPILVRWLDARDNVPQLIYFFTMSRFGGSNGPYLRDDCGAHSNHLRAVKVIQVLGVRDPTLIAALERNLEHYKAENEFKKGKGGDLAEITKKALNKLKSD